MRVTPFNQPAPTLGETAEAGVDVSLVMTGPEPTGTYLAVLDREGELVMGWRGRRSISGSHGAGWKARAT